MDIRLRSGEGDGCMRRHEMRWRVASPNEVLFIYSVLILRMHARFLGATLDVNLGAMMFLFVSVHIHSCLATELSFAPVCCDVGGVQVETNRA